MKPALFHIAAAVLGLAAPAALLSQDAAGPPTSATATTVDEVVVTASSDSPTGYVAPVEATGALKTPTRLLETPQAISIIERPLMVDQGARKIEEVIRNTAGVTTGGYFNDWDYYRIRGFDVSFSSSFVDGLASDGAPGEEIWGLERIEVVKGPASTLYGAGPLGGFVNAVSKRPKREFGGEVQFTGGQFDLYEGALDINIPLIGPDAAPATPTTGKGSKDVMPVAEAAGVGVYFRLNALYKDEGSFVDFAQSERIFVAPSLTIEFSPDTTLTILTSYKEDKSDLAFALPATGTVRSSGLGAIPINRYIGNPALGNDEWERNFRVGYEFKHRFNDTFAVRQNFRYFWLDWTSTNLSYPQELSEDNRTLSLLGFKADGTYEGLRVDTALDATFETGSIKHTLTTGVDYRWTEQAYTGQDSTEMIYLDLYRPRYSSLPAYQWGEYYGGTESDSDLGFYLQEQAKIGDKFTITLGGRFDISRHDNHPGKDGDEAFTPKVGVTYEFVPGIAAYANYSRSYNPQWYSTDASGKAVEPEEGENWEAGVKYNVLDGKLTGMVSVFQLTRENVATLNLSSPDPFDSIVSGEQRSRGFEFETAAKLLPGLDFTMAYTYIDAEITEDNEYATGTRLQGVPDHWVNAFLKYTIQDGPLKGLGVGLGGRYFTSQGGDIGDTFELPAYGIVDAALYYERDDFRFQVNFDNIFDKRYFAGSYDALYVLPGAPFNVTASVTWKF